ncbi:ABC-type dipeptide/oligopeptide/nickel transport system, permease component [Hoeflea phototrophica DFL-43]|uniref:ABC-type dipeptide/oligopeptide/nickel transport system, permease component n=1 Tax=Hoeflea phototrophica (strain DSM 17068 / NCIMB 14078 / DFL-43) TaxID=411684 RepID=A9DF10_HOEPD|nr:ABC transporter permease [Hoeflea phototrophica]EDQ31873.1 ABC-type dipeptide/oligopeptide/nickel transport system, permease component [Hoeflea phototrophica DFL-43]
MLDGRGAVKRRAGARLWMSGLWLGLMALLALFAPLISPHDPLAQDLFAGRLPPFWVDGADPAYLLGTDSLGRDVLSRIMHGARIAFSVALVAGLATALVGSLLGLLAGYMRGWVDVVISRLVEIWMAFPPVLFAILLIAVLGTGLTSIIIAIVVIDWTRFCRVVRAEAMNQSAMDYVSSAVVAGRPRMDILWREILPNVLPTIVALLTLEMGIAVIVEAILSFVNLSISTDAPTWGGMIAEGRTSIYQAWWVLAFPLGVLFLTVLSFSQFGEGLKDRYDPVLR